MSIVSFWVGKTAEVGEFPRRNQLISTDSLALITKASYLNNKLTGGKQIYPTDVFDVIYDYNLTTNSGTYATFTVNITAGAITLVEFITLIVDLPVVSGDVAVFGVKSVEIKDSGAALSNNTIPYVVTSPGFVTMGDIPQFNDVNGTFADSAIVPANIMLLDAVNTLTSSGGITFSKGEGTEAFTNVTINESSGFITTSILFIPAGDSYAITWTNSFITANSVILLSWMGGDNTNTQLALQVIPTTNSATLTIFNNSASVSIMGTIVIGFNVF